MNPSSHLFQWVATVLTVYGIETFLYAEIDYDFLDVATVLTVYGIETGDLTPLYIHAYERCNSTYRLRY